MVTPKNEQVGNVRVCCRLRPLPARETNQDERKCVRTSDNIVHYKKETVSHDFHYDHVFTEEDDQLTVFNAVARPAVQDIIDGYNSTILTYGQTASGKTYTLQGGDADRPEDHGIIPRTAVQLFNFVDNVDEKLECTVKISHIEIYMEQVSDLLKAQRSGTKLRIREDTQRGFFVENMIETFVTSAEDLMNLVTDGTKRRAMAATKMNERSSRSHSVLLVTLSQKNVDTQVVKSGKLYLVDLAGSEMVRRTEAAGRRLEEAKMINRSLSTLGNVIHNLTDPKMNHVPYRNSTLTRILQDSFGGNSRTTLIVNISCSVWDSTETLSTLRFGTRAKKIKNQAVINERKSADDLMDIVTMLQRDLQLERNRVDLLKNRLETSTPHENVSASSDQGRSGMRSVPTSAHETAMSSEASTIEDMQQLQKKFRKLEEEYLKVQLESDRRGLEIQDLKARLDSKAQSMESFKFSCKEADKENKRIVARLECSLKTKDSQYSVLQSDHKQLEFKHKELTNHAEKLQQQVDMLSSQGVNRSSLYDIAELQSPGAGVKGKESEYLHAMQQKLVHLVAVQRQLLGKVAASEKNTKEAKRKVTVRDDRIKELRASNRRITERLRKEAEKHVVELIRLRGHISDFQGAQDAHLQSYGHMEEPFIRALRGGGAEGQVDSMEHPRQWDDEVRPIRRGSQCSSTSATSEESLAEVMRIHSDQRL